MSTVSGSVHGKLSVPPTNSSGFSGFDRLSSVKSFLDELTTDYTDYKKPGFLNLSYCFLCSKKIFITEHKGNMSESSVMLLILKGIVRTKKVEIGTGKVNDKCVV